MTQLEDFRVGGDASQINIGKCFKEIKALQFAINSCVSHGTLFELQVALISGRKT